MQSLLQKVPGKILYQCSLVIGCGLCSWPHLLRKGRQARKGRLQGESQGLLSWLGGNSDSKPHFPICDTNCKLFLQWYRIVLIGQDMAALICNESAQKYSSTLQTFPVRLLSNSCHFQFLTMHFYCHWHECDRRFNNVKFSGNFFGEIYCQWQGLDRGLINKENLGEIARIFHW